MNKKTQGLTWAILSISLLTVMAGAAIAPALGAIRSHFANSHPLTIQLILSLPALFIIVSTLLFRSYCRLFRTRTLALLGLSIYVVAGAGAFFVDNISLLLLFRALLGISVGMIMPLSTGLLSYYFPPDEQSHLMGLSAAMNQLGGVIATLLAGILASFSWNYAFLVYLAGLLAIILVATKLPNERLIQPGGAIRLSSLTRFHPSVTSMLFIMLLFFIYPTNFALTAQSANLSTISTTLIMVGLDVVAFFIGLLFGYLMRHFRQQMKYIAPICFLLGYLLLALFGNIWGMILGSALIGIANGVGVPYVNTIASIKGGHNAAVTVMPLISASLYLGQFLSPILVNPLSSLFGNQPSSPYFVACLLAILYLLQTILTRNHHALPPNNHS